jgi:hypothetical protein
MKLFSKFLLIFAAVVLLTQFSCENETLQFEEIAK